MNAGGWFFMITSLALVWGVTIWAYARLLRARRDPPSPPASPGAEPADRSTE